MSRKPTVSDDAVVLDPEGRRAEELAELAEAEEIDTEEAGEIFRVTEEILAADSTRLIITRTFPKDLYGYVGEMSPSEFTMDRIAQEFGPGKYRIRVMGPRGFVKGGGKVIIAPRSKPAQAGDTDIRTLLEELDKRNQQRAEASRNRTLEIITALGPTIAPILAAIVGRQGPDIAALIAATKGPSMPELMTALGSLKALVPAPEPTADPVDRALKLLDVIQEKAPRAQGETGMLDLLKEAIKAVGPSAGALLQKIAVSMPPAAPGQAVGQDAAAQLPAGQSPAAQPRLPAPQPAPNGAMQQPQAHANIMPPAPAAPGQMAPVSAPVSEADPNMNLALLKILPWFRAQLDQMIARAARGIDPALAAEMFLAEFPEGTNPDEFLPLLADANWFVLLQRFDARVAQHPDWFAEMRASLLEQAEALRAEALSAAPPAAGIPIESVAPVSPAPAPGQMPSAGQIERPTGPPSLMPPGVS